MVAAEIPRATVSVQRRVTSRPVLIPGVFLEPGWNDVADTVKGSSPRYDSLRCS